MLKHSLDAIPARRTPDATGCGGRRGVELVAMVVVLLAGVTIGGAPLR